MCSGNGCQQLENFFTETARVKRYHIPHLTYDNFPKTTYPRPKSAFLRCFMKLNLFLSNFRWTFIKLRKVTVKVYIAHGWSSSPFVQISYKCI